MSGTNQDNYIIDKVQELQDELQLLNKLFDLNKIINSVTDIDSLAVQLVEFLLFNVKLKNAGFFLLDDDKYKLIACENENIEYPQLYELENLGEGIWQILESGKPLNITNDKGENIFYEFFETNQLLNLDSAVWLPFIHDGNILAIVTLGLKVEGDSFTNADYQLFEKIIMHYSPVINKFKKEKEKESNLLYLQKNLHNISILYNIGQAMNFIDDLKRLIQIILAKAIQTLGAEKGSLMLYDSASEELVVKVVYGLPDKEVEAKINEGRIECTRIKIGEGIAGEAFANKKAIITNLGESDPRFFKSDLSNVQSILCLPLIVKEEAIGVINITNKKDDKFFNQDDLDFMGALANQAAIAISNAQLYELAITDSLTKLFIRRHFEYLLDNEIRRSNRYRHHLSLLMIDIDNFKSINDTYGHQVGDDLLRKVSNVIIQTIRKIDMPSRYGGEEFAIILPETHKDNSKKIAERLRKKIEEIEIITKKGEKIGSTVSIGIGEYPIDANNKENLIYNADQALYFAKKMGKNCVAEYNIDGCSLVKG